MKRLLVVLLLLAACAPPQSPYVPPPPPAASEAPTLIFHNGVVFRGRESLPDAQAIAIRGENILAVGSDAEVLALAGPSTKVVNLHGRLLLPGLNDAHVHSLAFHPEDKVLNLAEAQAFYPGEGPTFDEVRALIATAAKTYPAGSRLVAIIGNAALTDPRATRDALDAVAPEHLVLLRGASGHGTIANSAALAFLGIGDEEPNPEGGSYERYADTNRVNGRIHEAAEMRYLRTWIGKGTPPEALAGMMDAYAAGAARLGVTSYQDMVLGLSHREAFEVAQLAKNPVRHRVICFPVASPSEDPCIIEASGDGRVWADGMKLFFDGTGFERGGCVRIDYVDAPGVRGVCNYTDEQLLARLRPMLAMPPGAGSQVLLHVFGDRAFDQLFNVLQRLGGPNALRGRRWRIEHATLARAEHVLFMAEYARQGGLVFSQQYHHAALVDPADGVPVYARRFGEVTSQNPNSDIVHRGVSIAGGTDGVGAPFPIFTSLAVGVTHPLNPDQALSMRKVLESYTWGSAYAAFVDDRVGTLEPGKVADIAVLSTNLLQPGLPFTAIQATSSRLTLVGGEPVWDPDGMLSK